MRTESKLTIVQIECHRNGVGGEPFHAILFRDDGYDPGFFVATVFETPGYVSVLRVPDLSDKDRGVTFGMNSWRGDHYEGRLRKAITDWQAEQDRVWEAK